MSELSFTPTSAFSSILLILLAFTMISSASSLLPFTRSHLGDSGRRPGQARRRPKTTVGAEMPSWRLSQRGRAQARRGTVR